MYQTRDPAETLNSVGMEVTGHSDCLTTYQCVMLLRTLSPITQEKGIFSWNLQWDILLG